MVFKGFTDENGNVIPVQGAGTVYNEEKNSLALGKDTSAIGQDQLVFGRANEADANKAEIVGGGSTSESSGSGSAELSIVIGTTPANYRCVLVLEPIANLASEGITWGQVTGRYYYKIVSRTAYVEGSDFYVFKNSPLYFIETQVPVEQLVSYENFENPAQDVENGKYFTIMVGEKEAHHLSSAYVYRGVVNTPMLTRKNIRTLDWNGHEYLLGSLAIGEDSVAGTKGQLVFGKGNMANAYKAEIVGNGKDNIDDITDDVITYISTLPVGTVLTIKTNASSWLKELSLRIVTHTYSEFASKFPLKHFNTIDFELMHSADASRIIACCEVVSEIPDVWGTSDLDIRHDKAAPMLLVRSSTYKLLLVSPTELDVDGTSLTTRFSYANGERISGVTAPKNIRTLDWNGNQWNAGDVTCDDGNGNTISMRDLLSRIATLEAAAAES